MNTRLVIFGLIGVIACGEGGNLAISAGAPVTAVVRGTVTFCSTPASGAEVVLRVQQDRPEQARPVDTRIGPVTTTRSGKYLIEVGPSFAVPGPASMQLQVTFDGVAREIPGGTLELRLGMPASDTTQFDVDLGLEQRVC